MTRGPYKKRRAIDNRVVKVGHLMSQDVPIRKACRMVGLNRSTFMNRLTSANLSEFKSNYPPA